MLDNKDNIIRQQPNIAGVEIHRSHEENGEHIIIIRDYYFIDVIKCKDGFNLSGALDALKEHSKNYTELCNKYYCKSYWNNLKLKLSHLLQENNIQFYAP